MTQQEAQLRVCLSLAMKSLELATAVLRDMERPALVAYFEGEIAAFRKDLEYANKLPPSDPTGPASDQHK